MTLEDDIRPFAHEQLPDLTVVDERSWRELYQPSGYTDPETGKELTLLQMIKADETWDDGMYAVGAQGVYLVGEDADPARNLLSEEAMRHNQALTRDPKAKPEDRIVAVVSRRPTDDQYKKTVALRERMHEPSL